MNSAENPANSSKSSFPAAFWWFFGNFSVEAIRVIGRLQLSELDPMVVVRAAMVVITSSGGDELAGIGLLV